MIECLGVSRAFVVNSHRGVLIKPSIICEVGLVQFVSEPCAGKCNPMCPTQRVRRLFRNLPPLPRSRNFHALWVITFGVLISRPIGRASYRESECKYVYISVVA